MSQDDAPAHGVPLRWRLGLTTSVIVTLVLGTLTAAFQVNEIEKGRVDRERLLGQSAAPLAADVESAPSVEAIRERLSFFEAAHARRGHEHLHVALVDSGAPSSAPASPFAPPGPIPPSDALRARIPVDSDLLAGGHGTILVWQDASEFQALVLRRWRFWGLSLAVAVASIVLSLYFAYQFLIGRPLRGLLEGVRQMELGYWSGLSIPRGAWEMRWLAYRFRNLGSQLEETVRHVVEADRRAVLGLDAPAEAHVAGPHVDSPGVAGPGDDGDASAVAGEPLPEADGDPVFRRKLLRRYLVSRCRYLESHGGERGDRSDRADRSSARAAAREAWEKDAAEAMRLGEYALKSRLEDAALRVLEPEAWDEIRRGLAAHPATQKQWLRASEKGIRRALAHAHVRHRSLQHRVKHTAGIFRKMKAKGLALEQVHDLVAFRIIVPAEQDCYVALDAIHQHFEPLLLRFKDYVAAPKKNGYRSLHTCVKGEDGLVFEVQIRTLEMHERSEGGDAAHWRYKAGASWDAAGAGLRSSVAGLSKAIARRRRG